MEVAFPELEKRYIQVTVKQMESYRKSRYPLPEYLLNRPHTVQGECLVNQEKAKAITNSMLCSTQQEGVFLVSGNPKYSPKSGYQVHIIKGQCSCAYFTLKKIPCKHIFAVFNHFPEWAWHHLPASLTEAPHMTLDESIRSIVGRGFAADGNDANVDSNDTLSHAPVVEPTQQIPIPTTTGKQIYIMQRKARDALAECISLVFCTTELSTLEAINTEALAMKKVLLSKCSSSTTPDDIPTVNLLSKCIVRNARNATKQYARTGIRLKRLHRSKHAGKAPQTDPLINTMSLSCQRGRPRKKKEQRKKPPLLIRVSVDTRTKALRAAAAKRLGKH